MEISANFIHSHVNHTQDNDTHLVVSIKAPAHDWMAKRPKLCITLLADLSGSMRGDKLKYAKESMDKLVDQLAPGDFIGLIGFESRIHVLLPPQEVTSQVKDQLKKIIRDLQVMGSTNLSDGLEASFRQINQLDLPPAFIKRVIMFTDGQPTVGVCDAPTILRLMEANRGPVTVSAFGYGNGTGDLWGCDQEFLTALSEKGRGNYAYVQNPDDALSAFGKELGGLLSTYATDLRLELEPVNGHQVTEVVTNVPFEKDALGEHLITLSDILSEETRHFVFKAKLFKQNQAFPRDTTVFNLKLSYSQLLESGSRETKELETKARVRFVKADDVTPVNADLEQIVALHQVIRAQLEAEKEAKQGNYEQAQLRMQQVADDYQGYAQVANVARGVGRRLSASSYGSSSGFLRSTANMGTRAYGVAAADKDAVQLMCLAGVDINNNAQEVVSTSFVTGSTGTPLEASDSSTGGIVVVSGSSALPESPSRRGRRARPNRR